jgi:flagellar motor switch protein FliM
MEPGILSPSELEALLADAPGTAACPASANQRLSPKVKTYDFRRPDKLSRDQVRSLQIMHEVTARAFTASLSARFRGVVQVSVNPLEQCSYADFCRRLGEGAVLNLMSLSPLAGQALIELDAATSTTFVDRLLGGEGKLNLRRRPPTDIEMALLRTLVEGLLPDIQEGWRSVAEVHPRLLETILATDFLHTTPASDPVTLVKFGVQLGENAGSFTLCLPWALLEPVMPKLNVRAVAGEQPAEKPGEPSPAVGRYLRGMEVVATALLGSTALPIGDLLSLREGDVVRLDQRMGNPVKVNIAGKLRFRARPGLHGGRRALQVTEILKAELDA